MCVVVHVGAVRGGLHDRETNMLHIETNVARIAHNAGNHNAASNCGTHILVSVVLIACYNQQVFRCVMCANWLKLNKTSTIVNLQL